MSLKKKRRIGHFWGSFFPVPFMLYFPTFSYKSSFFKRTYCYWFIFLAFSLLIKFYTAHTQCVHLRHKSSVVDTTVLEPTT